MTKKTSTRIAAREGTYSGVEEYDGHDRQRAQAVNVPPVAKPRRRGSTRLLRPRLLHEFECAHQVRWVVPGGAAGGRDGDGTQRRVSRHPARPRSPPLR